MLLIGGLENEKNDDPGNHFLGTYRDPVVEHLVTVFNPPDSPWGRDDSHPRLGNQGSDRLRALPKGTSWESNKART